MTATEVVLETLTPGEVLDLNRYKIEQVKIDTKYCVTEDVHDSHVRLSIQRGLPPMEVKLDGTFYDPIAVVCSGPSLENQIDEVRKFSKILTCSGAHDFLIGNGIIPTWHMEADPRKHKAKFIENPHRDVQYMLSSSCHPLLFDTLKDYNVRIWHVLAGERRRAVFASFPRGQWFITGGSNVGMRALIVARMMGYTNIHIFGMDCSAKSAFHIGEHPNEPRKEKWITVKVGDSEYQTSHVFLAYAQQFFKEISKIADAEFSLHGDGLLQAISSRKMSDPEEIRRHMAMREPTTIALMNPHTISAEYLSLNQKMHEREDFGAMGYKCTDVVIDMAKAIKAESVLDYGCGKGSLAKKLPFPIWEYDPAIPGKGDVPRPADLVVCTDVLEHIEPEMLENTLRDLARCVLKAGYFVIHTSKAAKQLPDGRNTHLIQEGAEWWTNQLEKYFHVVKVITRQLPELIIVVGPKKDKVAEKPFISAKRRWSILEGLVKANGWTKGVEVGVKEGFTFLHLLQTCPTLDLTGVDLFRPRPGLEAAGGESHADAKLPEHEKRLRKTVKAMYPARGRIVRKESVKAAKTVADHSLDFVFIDADHREDAVRADIQAWMPKIRSGGMLTGHDAQSKFPGVLAAINDLCPGWQQHSDSVWSLVVK